MEGLDIQTEQKYFVIKKVKTVKSLKIVKRWKRAIIP